jgi:hypothetical protein
MMMEVRRHFAARRFRAQMEMVDWQWNASPFARHGAVLKRGPQRWRGVPIGKWQRTESARVRSDVFSTRYKVSSNRSNDRTWMCRLGRREAGAEAQRLESRL